MILISLMINIAVLIPVTIILVLKTKSAHRVFGNPSTSQEILLSMYFSILLMSIWAAFDSNQRANTVVPLFTLQIIYKFISVFLIRDKKTPVLWFNLGIALLHSYTLFSMFRT